MNINQWISKNALASVAMFFSGIFIFVVMPLVWFDTHGGGEYFGAVVGFLALLTGALFNAELERRRDDRLHLQEMQVALAATKSELLRNSALLSKGIIRLKEEGANYNTFLIKRDYDLMSDHIFRRNVEKVINGLMLAEMDVSETAQLDLFYGTIPIARNQIDTLDNIDTSMLDKRYGAVVETMESLQKYARASLKILTLAEIKLNSGAVAIQLQKIQNSKSTTNSNDTSGK